MASSDTGGVKPIQIMGRLTYDRERLIGMTDEERAWRKQWVQDQFLSKNEPRHVPELENEFVNPIRRFYRAPLDKLCDVLTPSLGFKRAYIFRFFLGKGLLLLSGVYLGAYYIKYNGNDWTRKGGWRVIQSRKASNPGDEDFPRLSERSAPSDYASRGFKEARI